jgi:hypothetical protein
MQPTVAQLKQKAQGFVLAIDKMSDKAKQDQPTPQFGKDYNRLVTMVRTAAPELALVLPPEVEFGEFSYVQCTVQTFNEVCAYCQQIIQMLP